MLHTGRIVPVYEKTGHLTAKMQRVLVHHALAQLPARNRRSAAGRRSRGASSWSTGGPRIHDVHFPPEGASIEALNGSALPRSGG